MAEASDPVNGKTVAGLAGGALLVLVAGGAALWYYGGNAREQSLLTQQAAHVSHVADSTAHAVADSVLHAITPDSAAIRAHLAIDDAQLNAERRKTNQAIATGNAAVEAIRKQAADSLATLAQLHVELANAADSLDALTVRFGETLASERRAGVAAIAARDSAIAQVTARERLGLLTIQQSTNTAFAARDKATSAAVSLASSEGKRRGRIEGVVVTVATEVVLAFAYHAVAK